MGRCHYPRRPENEEIVPTLCITATEGTGNWSRAIREIRQHLVSEGLSELAIEILDRRIFYDLHTFPIHPTDTHIIDRWNHYRPQVLTYLRDKVRNAEWATLNVFYRGVGSSPNIECFSTVLLSVPDPSNKIWHEKVYPDINAICSEHFRIETTYYSGKLTIDDDEEAANLSPEDFKRSEILMGSSCSPADTESSGSLGGAVALRKDSELIGIFGLTNSHVVCNRAFEHKVSTVIGILGGGERPIYVLTWVLLGLGKNESLRSEDALSRDEAITVLSPSTQDTNGVLQRLTSAMETYRQILESAPGEVGLRAQVDQGIEDKRWPLEMTEKGIVKSRKQFDTVSNFDCQVGHVYAASGLRALQRKASGLTDAWALD